MKYYSIFFILFLTFSCETEPIKQYNSNIKTSTVSIAKDIIHLQNRYFKYFKIQNNNDLKDIVLDITQEEIIDRVSGKSLPKMIIKPYKFKNNWEINSNAHDISIENNTLTTIYFGKDETEDTYGLYSLNKGTHLLDCTYDVLKVKIPKAKFKRYIGYTSRSNAKNLLKNEDKNVIGIVSYASEKNLIKQFLIKTSKDVGNSTPDMELVSFNESAKLFDGNQLLYFWNLDENYKPTDVNFAFGYTFFIGENSEETAIMFEVENDELLLKNTKFDKQVFEILEK